MSDIYGTDSLTDSLDRLSSVLTHAVADQLDVDAEVDRVELISVLDRTTLTIIVSWDPNGKPISEMKTP